MEDALTIVAEYLYTHTRLSFRITSKNYCSKINLNDILSNNYIQKIKGQSFLNKKYSLKSIMYRTNDSREIYSPLDSKRRGPEELYNTKYKEFEELYNTNYKELHKIT